MSTATEIEKDIVFENDKFIFHKIVNYDNKFYYDMMVKYPNYWNLNPAVITDPKFFEAYTKHKPFLFILDKVNDVVFGATLIYHETSEIVICDQKGVHINDTMFFGLTEQEFASLFNK